MSPIKYYHISELNKCMKTHIHLMSAEQIWCPYVQWHTGEVNSYTCVMCEQDGCVSDGEEKIKLEEKMLQVGVLMRTGKTGRN